MSSVSRLPSHLKKYVVDQNYSRYTAEDQAVWRFILRQLREFLSTHAHECYRSGLEKTGIQIDEIPRIEDMDNLLGDFGWGAVAVSGFIPPAAFMEFQSLGVLPIASDMRSLDQLLYTPAPDIVHEAAGHAPILADPKFAEYLRKYAEVARNSIISSEDLDQYNAIRALSDVKADPDSTSEEIQETERRLDRVNLSMQHVSEAALLSRMNWWTAEYGLIGNLKNPKIYGAGLLSSVGESRLCLGDSIKKIELTVDCIDFSYDITEPQPQLFVTPDFQTLQNVLENLADRLSYRRGGAHGLSEAKRAKTVNTAQLDSGVQISGVLESFLLNSNSEPYFLKFTGPCQLSSHRQQMVGQGVDRHAHGFSSPIGPLKDAPQGLGGLSESELAKIGLQPGKTCRLEYVSGIVLEGTCKAVHTEKGKLQIVTFAPCKVTHQGQLLFDPAWGEFDLAVGEKVVSVFGGPADRSGYGDTEDFSLRHVPPRKLDRDAMARNNLFASLRACRNKSNAKDWSALTDTYLRQRDASWLAGLELLEMGFVFDKKADPKFKQLHDRLEPRHYRDPSLQQTISDGLKIADRIV